MINKLGILYTFASFVIPKESLCRFTDTKRFLRNDKRGNNIVNLLKRPDLKTHRFGQIATRQTKNLSFFSNRNTPQYIVVWQTK